jgi:hypothetical protein
MTDDPTDVREFVERKREVRHVAEVDVDVPEETWRFIVEEWYEGDGVPDTDDKGIPNALTSLITFDYNWQVPDLDSGREESE